MTRLSSPPAATLRVLMFVVLLAAAAWAHYTWVAPVTVPLEIGQPATVRIGHGHQFPESEEAINARQVDLFVVAPSGARTKLTPIVSGPAVTASFAVKEAGLHRFALVQDRGITSRTPAGVRPGGRDKNPTATQAARTLRTAVAYAGTSRMKAVDGKPIGMEVELAGTLNQGTWELLLLKQGKPAPGVSVQVFLAGAAEATQAGKTDSDGRLRYRAPGDKGSALFLAGAKDPAPSGAAYDFVNYETSLSVSW